MMDASSTEAGNASEAMEVESSATEIGVRAPFLPGRFWAVSMPVSRRFSRAFPAVVGLELPSYRCKPLRYAEHGPID